MQGINPLTMKCNYETPCGWCTKWDKKCDMKIPERGKRIEINPVDDFANMNLICKSESDHQWECCGISTAGSTYRCKICGEHKSVPITSSESTTISVHLNNQSSRSCDECDKNGWDMPQCKECNASNDFKYFERKKNTNGNN